MNNDPPVILIPSKKKIFIYSIFFLTLATCCFFIELMTNKITQGTSLIRFYESAVFYLLSVYYLLQVIPGYAKLIIDDNGFREIWFFRQRINVSWFSIIAKRCKQTRAGDTLYINSENEQLFSRKMVCKACYSLTDKQIFQNFVKRLNQLKQTRKNSKIDQANSRYLVLGQMRLSLIIIFSLIVISFNTYYLTSETPDKEFIEQVNLYIEESKAQGKQQTQIDEQLFNSFKIYGFYWKQQLKQFDRNLFHRVLLQESLQIEKALLKRKESHHPLLEADKNQFLQQLARCKDQFLFYDDIKYLQCLEKL